MDADAEVSHYTPCRHFANQRDLLVVAVTALDAAGGTASTDAMALLASWTATCALAVEHEADATSSDRAHSPNPVDESHDRDGTCGAHLCSSARVRPSLDHEP